MTKGHETYNQLTRDKGRELVYMGENHRLKQAQILLAHLQFFLEILIIIYIIIII